MAGTLPALSAPVQFRALDEFGNSLVWPQGGGALGAIPAVPWAVEQSERVALGAGRFSDATGSESEGRAVLSNGLQHHPDIHLQVLAAVL